jgi:hypothetical protein
VTPDIPAFALGRHEDEIATEDTEDTEKRLTSARVFGVFGVFGGYFTLYRRKKPFPRRRSQRLLLAPPRLRVVRRSSEPDLVSLRRLHDGPTDHEVLARLVTALAVTLRRLAR